LRAHDVNNTWRKRTSSRSTRVQAWVYFGEQLDPFLTGLIENSSGFPRPAAPRKLVSVLQLQFGLLPIFDKSTDGPTS